MVHSVNELAALIQFILKTQTLFFAIPSMSKLAALILFILKTLTLFSALLMYYVHTI